MPETLIHPDALAAADHRKRLELLLTTELDALLAKAGDDQDVSGAGFVCQMTDLPLYPGLYVAYHWLSHEPSRRDTARLARLMSHAADYRRRRPHGLARTHESDYADGCVRRALAKAPADFDSAKITSHLTRWSDEHLDILGKAVAVLAKSWPEAHDEMEAAVGEVFLLGGHGLVGFTDFVAHGAIFISDHQLSPRNGIGAEYLLAESLLHETTHTVCNAAATADPWIRKPSQGETFLVPTPLRADPRPLAGLAQQFVVLTRCSEFYWRVAGKGPEGLALEHRARSLSEQAVSAATTLRRFSANLTETGGRALEEGLIQLGRRAPDAGKV